MASDFCCCNVHIKLQEYLYPPTCLHVHSLSCPEIFFFYKHRMQFFIVGVAQKSTLVPFVSHIPDFSYYCQNKWYYKTAFALLLKLCEPNIVKQQKVCLICLYNETWSKKERLFLFLTKIRNEYIFANVISFLACDDTKSIKVWKNSLNKKKSWWHHVSLWFEQAFVWCFIIFKT